MFDIYCILTVKLDFKTYVGSLYFTHVSNLRYLMRFVAAMREKMK